MTLCFCCGGWTGALGVGFGLASWIMGAADLAKMRTGDMDRSGEGQTRAGYVCGIIGTVLGVLLLLCAVGGTLLMLSGNAAPFGAPGAFGGKGGRF
jgi:hypothetical protein